VTEPATRIGSLKSSKLDHAATAAEVPRIRFHDSRHSAASQMVMGGVPLTGVAKILGHSETKMTDRYSHLTPAAEQSYIEVLDKPPAVPAAKKPGA